MQSKLKKTNKEHKVFVNSVQRNAPNLGIPIQEGNPLSKASSKLNAPFTTYHLATTRLDFYLGTPRYENLCSPPLSLKTSCINNLWFTNLRTGSI
ncbi:hypothetical protein QL285_077366 [Trifolium repens]|nr:hypothetical protein QL285_077366 [Trifolium repens]